MNYIGKLQEYSQRNGYKLPSYKIYKKGGPPHMPKFQCELKFNVSYNFKSDICYSKKEAKINVAKKCYESLEGNSRSDEEGKYDYILVDTENLPKFLDTYNLENIIGISSTNHPQSVKRKDDPRMLIVDSDKPNACDVAIIFKVAQIIMTEPNVKNIAIATEDKSFSLALKDCIETNFIKLKNKCNIHIINKLK